MWFETLTGFKETPQNVRNYLSIEGDKLLSHVNNKSYIYGKLETPTLNDLRKRLTSEKSVKGKLSLTQVVADVQQLHLNHSNAQALFQVASQFNLLEMPSSCVTPDEGVSNYEYDKTQGPACAIAAGAGTLYRNYFVNVNGQIGQSAYHQIDCLRDIAEALGNRNNRLWKMKNGYALAEKKVLMEINKRLSSASESEIDALKGVLRIGIQWNTQVTLDQVTHTVTQVYGSALPVAYSDHFANQWERFARLILEASYEATLLAGVENFLKTGNNTLYLTLLGGGVFGNKEVWIIEAIKRALTLFRGYGLNICIVSYRKSHPSVRELVEEWES